MKRLFILLLTCISYIPFFAFAEETNIKLQEMEFNEEPHSIIPIPIVTYDTNIISIYTDVPLEEVQIAITNYSTEDILHFNNIFIPSGQPYILLLNGTENGYCKIEISTNKSYYYGFFEIISK